MMADAFDLAERLQTPVIMMTDLDLGMNDHVTEPLVWDDNRQFDRGKVLTSAQLDVIANESMNGNGRRTSSPGLPGRDKADFLLVNLQDDAVLLQRGHFEQFFAGFHW